MSCCHTATAGAPHSDFRKLWQAKMKPRTFKNSWSRWTNNRLVTFNGRQIYKYHFSPLIISRLIPFFCHAATGCWHCPISGHVLTGVWWLVCVFVCQGDYAKAVEWILTNLGGRIGHGPREPLEWWPRSRRQNRSNHFLSLSLTPQDIHIFK